MDGLYDEEEGEVGAGIRAEWVKWVQEGEFRVGGMPGTAPRRAWVGFDF